MPSIYENKFNKKFVFGVFMILDLQNYSKIIYSLKTIINYEKT
jgi:hypothetical protein